jgi:hypothetical protein
LKKKEGMAQPPPWLVWGWPKRKKKKKKKKCEDFGPWGWPNDPRDTWSGSATSIAQEKKEQKK